MNAVAGRSDTVQSPLNTRPADRGLSCSRDAVSRADQFDLHQVAAAGSQNWYCQTSRQTQRKPESRPTPIAPTRCFQPAAVDRTMSVTNVGPTPEQSRVHVAVHRSISHGNKPSDSPVRGEMPTMKVRGKPASAFGNSDGRMTPEMSVPEIYSLASAPDKNAEHGHRRRLQMFAFAVRRSRKPGNAVA